MSETATAGVAVTERDAAVLGWVGRWRHVTTAQVHAWLKVRPEVNPTGVPPGRALHYTAQGLRVVSEREMRQDARLGVSDDGLGRDRWTVPVHRAQTVDEHHPDLWVLPGHHNEDDWRVAVEMELTAKAAARLRQILDGYGRLLASGEIAEVVYLSDDPKVRKAVADTAEDLTARHDGLAQGLVVAAWDPDAGGGGRS